MGIEPTAQAWEAWVLPLYDARFRAILVGLREPGKWAFLVFLERRIGTIERGGSQRFGE